MATTKSKAKLTKKAEPASKAKLTKKERSKQHLPLDRSYVLRPKGKPDIPITVTHDVDVSTYKIDLPKAGTVKLKIQKVTDTVPYKVKMFGYPAKDKDGKRIVVNVQVPATFLTLTFKDGTQVKGRSCCKPPDHYNYKRGVELGLKRLLHNPIVGKHMKSQSDYESLIMAVMIKPPSKSKCRWEDASE